MTAPYRRLNFRQALRAANFEDVFLDSTITRNYAELKAKKLSFTQQMVLSEHSIGPRPYVLLRDVKSITRLITLRLIRFPNMVDRSQTVATEEGRAVMCYLLARWADVLAKIEEDQS